MKYFKVLFGENMIQREAAPLYVKARDMARVELWVLRNRPMEDYYGMNIIQVDPATKESYSGADFTLVAVSNYYRYEFAGKTDEEIRQIRVDQLINRIQKEVA